MNCINYCKDCGIIIKNKSKRCIKCSHQNEENRLKQSILKRGDKNPQWKGEEVGYLSLHEWVINKKIKSEFCENCKINKPYDLANISGLYKRDINDFKWLCRSCHMKEDGRINNLKQFQKKN
jgi:hypothetical protein